MKNKNIDFLINESCHELTIPISSIAKKEVEMNLVEFCLTHTSLRREALVDVCESLLKESYTSVIITEGAPMSVVQGVANLGRKLLHGAASPRDINNPESNPKSIVPIHRMTQGFGDWFNTKASNIRNGGIIQLNKTSEGDPEGKSGLVKYLVFPEIDMARPGHMEILKKIGEEESKAGYVYTIVGANDANRMNIAKMGTTITFVDKDKTALADKEALIKNLNDLSNYANKERIRFNRYAFIAPEEVKASHDELMKYLNAVLASQTKLAQDNANDAPEIAALANTALAAATSGTPGKQGKDMVKQNMQANFGAPPQRGGVSTPPNTAKTPQEVQNYWNNAAAGMNASAKAEPVRPLPLHPEQPKAGVATSQEVQDYWNNAAADMKAQQVGTSQPARQPLVPRPAARK